MPSRSAGIRREPEGYRISTPYTLGGSGKQANFPRSRERPDETQFQLEARLPDRSAVPEHNSRIGIRGSRTELQPQPGRFLWSLIPHLSLARGTGAHSYVLFLFFAKQFF